MEQNDKKWQPLKFIKEFYKGRIDRKKYALGILFCVIYASLLNIAFYYILFLKPPAIILISAPVTILILLIAIVIFSFSLHIRRFHDLERSGWQVLFLFVPLLNLVFLALLFFGKSEEHKNKYNEI